MHHGGAEQVAGIDERYLQAALDLGRRVVRDYPELYQRAIHVTAVVERLDLRLAALAPAIEIDRILFLDLGRVTEHHRCQGARRRRAIDGAAESLAHEVWQVAAVVEVGVT